MPRELRAITALLSDSQSRESLDRAIGCSNTPDVIYRLRRKGLDIPCIFMDDIDRDGLPIRRGVYFLTENDRRKVNDWQISGGLLN